MVTAAGYVSNVTILLSLALLIISGLWWLTSSDLYLFSFVMLFCWRYIRFFVNLVGFWIYKPTYVPDHELSYRGYKDVTVILPTIDPLGHDFNGCLDTCCQNLPTKVIIVTAGHALRETTKAVIAPVIARYRTIEFVIDCTDRANKRDQVGKVIPMIETKITVFIDDHVFWKPNLLHTMLQPFQNTAVGMVATNKCVRREAGLRLWRRCWNMLGALYLERHNFEIHATNAIDGGVFVVSGRTAAIRSEILQHPEFLPEYLNEKFLFGKCGPLAADDDNFITRFVVRHGWDIKVQYYPDACIETTVGVESPVVKKYLGQCTRWARTTWRSNSCSLFTDRTVWYRQPYCAYAVYLTSFTNFAAVVDPLQMFLLTKTQCCKWLGRNLAAVPIDVEESA
ncbi:Glycosyltransferase family 2 protein [Coniochaeta hoffmannii]|uniref:Glycosyltransferase family 2 protein n=1 Tax=Coniochaeta hoffmannii TaxID=91930 RepID=A0AA38VS09_9PEZI|nr:Glycosyltransferase family 2 protein [Coniochaeta hoffmannii]